MEVTGQAFEDMQEQNIRLLQQLREKDDANFKLMSEVIVIFRHILYISITVTNLKHTLFDCNVSSWAVRVKVVAVVTTALLILD